MVSIISRRSGDLSDALSLKSQVDKYLEIVLEIGLTKSFSGSSQTKILGTLPTVDSLDIAKHWMEACLRSHNICSKADDHILMPTRLILVTTDPPSLVLMAGWTHRPRYSTLSHCWDNAEFYIRSRQFGFADDGNPYDQAYEDIPRCHSYHSQAWSRVSVEFALYYSGRRTRSAIRIFEDELSVWKL